MPVEDKRRLNEKKFPNWEILSNTLNDYKSYSYRLLGHIYACEENHHKAVECLKSAITLSPQYADGYYDYAQYCAQIGNRNECLTALSKAIAEKSLYFYLAQKEKNFDPIRTDVENLITEINNEALQRVETEYHKAEKILNEVEKDIEEAKIKVHVGSYYREAENYYIETLLAFEKKNNMLASKDYSSILEALSIVQKALETIKNAKNIMKQGIEATQKYEEIQLRQLKIRRKKLKSNIGSSVFIIILIILIVFLAKKC